jgi:hypothetical protein
MAEPTPLRAMDMDERQLLKEAVCDAILERTRQVVSGDGIAAAPILGAKPSKSLSSGFILPRLDEAGDDESSDIRIASHGLDLRVRQFEGLVMVRPSLAVYVRTLPTSEEIFARNGHLLPRADFSPDALGHTKAEIRRRADAEIPPGVRGAERAARRAAISREVYLSMGVGVPTDAQLPGGDERGDEQADDDIPPPMVAGGRLRIPNHLSRRYETPQRWTRIEVRAPMLELPLPCDPTLWQAIADAHKRDLLRAIADAYAEFVQSERGAAEAWRRTRPQSEDFWSREAWDRFLGRARADPADLADLAPPFDVQLLVQAVTDPLDPEILSVRLALENLREGDASMECGLFGVALEVDIPDVALVPMRLERVRRSHHLAGFMTMPAIGVNGGVEEAGTVDGRRTLRTTWMPRYVLPRSTATVIGDVPTAYLRLAQEDLALAELQALPNALREWIEHVRDDTVLAVPGEEGHADDEVGQRIRFENDLLAWEAEAARILHGVTTLASAQRAWRDDPVSEAAIPYRAWLLLNRTFDAANPRRPDDPPPGWRLFQLAFVLAHVPTLASRIPAYAGAFDASFDEDAASLLYMSTGGGKTEAFFGTLVYSLFLDRLRGKRRGVTAMMHYPLRLLTVQQAQRLARLLAWAETVRRREGIGGAAFEIGFWVGGSNTPNRTERRAGEVDEDLRCIPAWNAVRARDEDALLASDGAQDRLYAAALDRWNKLPECPFCRTEGTVLRLFPEHHNRLGIVCRNQGCDWNEANAGGVGPTPLPFLLVDSDIYRRAPAVLLGTIDKLALLGQSTTTIDRIAGMFGMARWVEGDDDGLLRMPEGREAAEVPPLGTRRLAPAFEEGTELFHDPFPSLIVADEMHLLEESLGTFGGIFETGLFAWLTRLSVILGPRAARIPGAPDRPRLPHVIGATATAADVAKHTSVLYQRSVVQFPHPGPSLHEGFYTRMAAFDPGGPAAAARTYAPETPRGREGAAPWGRVYASLMTNGRLHTVTTLSVLAAHAAIITRWQRDLASQDGARRDRACAEIAASVSDSPWAAGRREVVLAAAVAGRHDRLASLVDLHRIELTYVTNKKGGDQILSALDSEFREAHAAMGSEYELSRFDMELISGGVDIGGIQRVIRLAERPFDPMTGNIEETLRGIVATSAISHGVDVETFNAMAFAGMPSDIAEYIQASSRVGRTHVGFSLLIPTPQTRRDRFVVEVHESFHRLLERMIAPPAVERWADRAIERTIPSLVQTWVAGVRHQERFARASAGGKADAVLPITVEQMERALRDPRDFDDCVRFVVQAIGVEAVTGAPANPEYYTDLIRNAAGRIRTVVEAGDFTGRLADLWTNPMNNLQRPMTSLRDVDAAGWIRASERTQRNQRLSRDDVGAAMAVVRNRGVSRRRQSANSELDGDT